MIISPTRSQRTKMRETSSFSGLVHFTFEESREMRAILPRRSAILRKPDDDDDDNVIQGHGERNPSENITSTSVSAVNWTGSRSARARARISQDGPRTSARRSPSHQSGR